MGALSNYVSVSVPFNIKTKAKPKSTSDILDQDYSKNTIDNTVNESAKHLHFRVSGLLDLLTSSARRGQRSEQRMSTFPLGG